MRRRSALLLSAAGVVSVAAIAAAAAHRHGRDLGVRVPGGTLITDAAGYDRVAGLLLGSFYRSIAANVAAAAPAGTRVLDVGCGPGHLSIALAGRHGLDVTGIDLDPSMIERAAANATQAMPGGGPSPSFLVASVADLPFAAGSFDLVVSTLSMHHWAEPHDGLAEIARVLRPGGRALIWDVKPGIAPFHSHVAEPEARVGDAPLRVVRTAPWRWPWRLALTQRIELEAGDGTPG